jgi:hypothetical protein
MLSSLAGITLRTFQERHRMQRYSRIVVKCGWAVGTAIVVWLGAGMAMAHEFWIDPVQFAPKTGATVPVVFRIGQNFQGGTYPYVRALDRRFVVVDGRGERKVKTLDGDDPAAEIKFTEPGLSIVAHQRAPEDLVIETFARFEEILAIEGLEHIGPLHRQSGRPMSNIRELYARCAKALINTGGGTIGNDRAIGMPLELIAEKSPYALPASTPLPVRLLYNGQPIAGVLVKSFRQSEPGPPRLIRTDAEGRALIDVSARGEYLISAVHMIEAAPPDKADWSSLWASLTFARP